MNPIHAHVFIADPQLPADHAGRRFGQCCPLPEDNACHSPPGRPPDDYTDRLTGDRADE